MRAAVGFIVAILAGCMAPSPDGGEPLAVSQVVIDLASLEGELAEVTLAAEPGARVRLDAIDLYPLRTSPPHCTLVGFKGREVASLGGNNPLRITSSGLGDVYDSEGTLERGMFNSTFSDEVEVPPDGRVVVRFGYASAEEWRGLGAKAVATATGSSPLAIVAWKQGQAGCVTDYSHYEEGEFTITPVHSSASGLRHDFTLRSDGFAWIVPTADLGYEFALQGPDGTTIEGSSLPGGDRTPVLDELDAGSYSFRVVQARGAGGTQVPIFYVAYPQQSA